MDIRNIAIVAHVDHGKTTLVDALLKASDTFNTRKGLEERAMDSNDQEKERGITIYAKNASITHNGHKINIVDTPGHADFGSEVERILRMVDAVLLVVDAYEGPMPQTKFVLHKSLELGHKVLVVVNKIDRPMSNPDGAINQIFDLFVSLGASEEQLDFPYIYAIAKQGIAVKKLDDERKDITPLIDFIFEHVAPAKGDPNAPFRMQPASLAYDNYLGRMAIGRVSEGSIGVNENIFVLSSDGKKRRTKATKLFTFDGMDKVETERTITGDIISLAGISDIDVGETIAADENAELLPAIKVDPPSLSIDFMVNNSPFAGREGKLVTSRQIRARLEKEMETNVGLKIEFVGDIMRVYGRGEMHIAVLLESMRREGFELQISQPEVVMCKIDGVKNEPIEEVVINVPDAMAGMIIQLISEKKGKLTNMRAANGNTLLEFEAPTRGLIGLQSQFILMTRGEGTFYHAFDHFAPHMGHIPRRTVGSMISGETGSTMAYSLWKLQERGPLFVTPVTEVYEGMVIGEYNQGTDLVVNPLKNKKLTNIRASGTDEAINLTPIVPMTLERAIEYVGPDEYVEITPTKIRLRKKFLTDNDRRRARNESKNDKVKDL
jgi:GTP-binding protein